MSAIQVGLIGFGLSGRYFHAPFLQVHPHFRLKTVVERSTDQAQAFDPSIRNARSSDELLADADIELVFICTPNDLHYSLAMDALHNGKHIVIEKPFALTEKEAVEIFELAEQKGLLATAYQNRRWDSDFLTLRRLIEEDRLGPIAHFASYYNRYRPEVVLNTWKEKDVVGGGNLYNLGPHLIDQALVLFGEPTAVWADIRALRPGSQMEDYFEVKLIYDDKTVSLSSSYLTYNHSLRYTVHGHRGSFFKFGLDVQEETLRQDQLPQGSDWGKEPKDRWGYLESDAYKGVIESERGDYAAFYENLYQAIRNKAPLAVQPAEIRRTTRVIDLAYQSQREQRVVRY
jgi:predicted dehydrogenase